VRLAEEGHDAELAQLVVAGELRAVVEGDGSAQVRGQPLEPAAEGAGDGVRLLGGLSGQGDQAGRPFVGGEQVLAVDGERHQIAFPVSGLATVGGFLRTALQ